MLSNRKQPKSDGFTIIEVLIVLAIAGLILLIVFLAVPALQRNARNTSRKNDVAAVLGGISEFTNNNGGVPPANQADINTALANAKIGYFPAANVFYGTGVPTVPATIAKTGGTSSTVTADDLLIYVGYTCGATPTVAPTAGSSRSIAATYAVETGNNPTYQCQGS